jgi:hypothetical protein
MLSLLHSLNLKLCSKHYNKIVLFAPDYLIVVKQQAVAGNMTTQPKQGRQDVPMSKLYAKITPSVRVSWSHCH